MKIFRWTLVPALCLLATSFCLGQSVDAFFGFNGLFSGQNAALAANGVTKLGGGFYPSVGGDLIFLPHNLGISAQVAWRGSLMNYGGYGLRPIFYDFNLAWEPVAPGSTIRPDFNVGIGAESLRLYTGQYTCNFLSGCTNYSSNNHFMQHVGVGVKIYVTQHIFLRPAVDYYHIDNNAEFGINSVWQAGIGVGYTLGPSS